MTEQWKSRIVGHGEEAPDQLLANPLNWRIHPKGQSEAMGKVLDKVGWVANVIVNKRTGNLVDGHLRVGMAIARSEPAVPVSYVDLSEEEERLVLLSLDPMAGLAIPDKELLASLVEGAGDLTALLGADLASSIEDLLPNEPMQGETDPDDIPEPPEEPITKPGDIWLLGDHRLLCGDATNAEDVERLLDGYLVLLCFTSPPYLQQRDYGAQISDWRSLMKQAFAFPSAEDCQILVNLGLVHRNGEVIRYWDDWLADMNTMSWRLFGWYVWDKVSATFKANDGRPYISHEWVFHLNRQAVPIVEWVDTLHAGEKRSTWGQRKPDGKVAKLSTPGRIKNKKPPDSIAHVQRETNNADESVRRHPARFPVQLADYWIKSWPGEVYDPFVGSGTTIIAAEQLGRKCYAMEIEPKYVDVCVKRWEDFTGRKAKRAK